MKKLSIILAAITVCVAIQSCNTVKDIGAFSTGSKTMKLKMTDFQYLGNCEVSADWDKYLGLFTHINHLNGEIYIPGNDSHLLLNQNGIVVNKRILHLVSATVAEKYPNADFFIVTKQSESKNILFLGSERNMTATIKAYKFKDKTDENLDSYQTSTPKTYSLDDIADMINDGKTVRGKTITAINTINFDFGSDKIKSESYPYLDKLATVLKQTNASIKVNGHTDNVGANDTNMKLSKDRAKSVVDYLADKGIDRNKLIYEGYGSIRPIATNDTEEGRAANRRVEFEILD